MKLIDINIDDVDFENRECLVSTKEKSIYFDARTKIHLKTSGVKISLEEQ